MSKRMLVDTHALLWWFTDPDLLSEPAARAMVDADGLLISPISFWEVATLVTKGRIELDRPTATWANDVLAQEATEEAPLTPAIIEAVGAYATVGEISDRLRSSWGVHRELITV